MFVTYPSAEVIGGLQFRDGTRQWAIVEQDLSIPWLYVCVTQVDQCFGYQRMLLVSRVEHFANLLDQLPDDATVTSVMSVVPDRSSAGTWSMIPVSRIQTFDDEGQPRAKITLINGDGYDEYTNVDTQWVNGDTLYSSS